MTDPTNQHPTPEPSIRQERAAQDLEAKDAELGQAYAELNRLQVERDAEQGAFVAVTTGRDRLCAVVSGLAAVAEGALADPSMDRDYVLRRLAEKARAALREATTGRAGDGPVQQQRAQLAALQIELETARAARDRAIAARRAVRNAVGEFRRELGGLEPAGPTAALLRALERAVGGSR